MTNSQIAALTYINERPGLCIHTIGVDYANALCDLGFITIRRGKCYPTPAAAPYTGRSAKQLRADAGMAHAALLGRWAASY